MFIELIDHSAIFFFLTIHIILSKLLRFFKTVFQQFKIHRRRKNINLKLFGLARAKGYSYKVKAVKKTGGKEYISASYSKAVEAVTKPAKASCTAKSAGSGSIEVSWKAVGGASGYEIYSSSNGSDYVKSAKVGGSKKSAIVSGFEPYSLRMVKVRAYKTVNGKTSYGAFSQAVMVIIR